MQLVKTIREVREVLNHWRLSGNSIAFVPTMGNLHAGHIALVAAAKQSADKVVASIFVNPSQFGVGEDFSAYPRTEAEDARKLEAANTDLLFLPTITEIYPSLLKTTVRLTELASLHCGASRAGHFDGVATVVCKLFNIVQPNQAFFGLKDYQQFVIIKSMVNDLNIPVELIGVETVRENNGLAMSSRNGYLNPAELKTAPSLYQTLCNARDKILLGNQSYSTLENQAKEALTELGFIPDYFNICHAATLAKANENDENLVILAAAKLGRARLIDNVLFNVKKQ